MIKFGFLCLIVLFSALIFVSKDELPATYSLRPLVVILVILELKSEPKW
jgi:hypothetical protein